MSTRATRILLGISAVVVIILILWIDFTTDVWQSYVIVSGLAGGLITFVLTALVVEKIMARSAHERWEPVTRLALSDVRRALVDQAVAEEALRRLPDPGDHGESLSELITATDFERDTLVASLSRWSAFLSSSADVTELMDTVAEIAMRLDTLDHHARAARALPSESEQRVSRISLIRSEITEFHLASGQLLGQIDTVLESQPHRLHANT